MTERSSCRARSTCPGAWPRSQLSATRALYLGPEGAGGDAFGCSDKGGYRAGSGVSEAATRVSVRVWLGEPSGCLRPPEPGVEGGGNVVVYNGQPDGSADRRRHGGRAESEHPNRNFAPLLLGRAALDPLA